MNRAVAQVNRQLVALQSHATAVFRTASPGPARLWLLCFLVAAVIHLGTAILRLSSFFPFPRALDFASYYAGAWSLRLDLSPYGWSPALISWLMASKGLPVSPPAHHSSPLWAWALQPFTHLSFPMAATIWLLLSLLITAGCHVLLVRNAGYSDRQLILWTFPLTLSFGPLFLNLTLGQNAVLLLLSALLIAHSMKDRPRYLVAPALLLWVLAVGGKIYPLLWAGSWLFLKRWRLLLAAGVLLIAAFGLVAVLHPEVSNEYWFDFLPERTAGLAGSAGIDDQSLNAFLNRSGRSNSYSVPGLSTSQRHEVSWHFPWELSPLTLRSLSALLLLGLALLLLLSWVKALHTPTPHYAPAVFYTLILFSLLLFPHMARYNHVLALPAMAWLWQRPLASRHLVVTAYLLLAISRLNHLWVIALPPFPAALLSGAGLFAVLLLLVAIGYKLVRRNIYSNP